MHPDSWAMLNDIANAAHIAEHVTRLWLCNAEKVDNTDWSSLVGGTIAMAEWQKKPNYRICGSTTWSLSPKSLIQGIGSTTVKAYSKSQAMHTPSSSQAVFSSYNSWSNAQKEMVWSFEKGKLPKLDLYKFPNLENVWTLESRATRNYWFANEEGTHECKHNLQELETGLICDDYILQNTHLNMFMHAAYQCDFALTMLVLRHFSELLPDRVNRDFHIPNLRQLYIREPSKGKPMIVQKQRSLSPEDALAPWVTTLCNLETFLVARTHVLVDHIDIFAMLKTVRWPKLRKVHLAGVRTTAANLRHFLLEMYPHKVLPFTELTILEPIIEPAEWMPLRKELLQLEPVPKLFFLGDAFDPEVWDPDFGKREDAEKTREWWENLAAKLKDWPSYTKDWST